MIVRGHNEDEVADFAAFAREYDVKMRYIEFMPLDSGHEWAREDVVSGKEIRERINERFPLVRVDVVRGSDTSSRYGFADGAPGEIGIIAPVTEPFCGACSRIRLTADGQIRTCLFSTVEHSLRDVLPGAIATTIVLEVTFQALPIYLHVARDSTPQRAFGGPVILLVWLYVMANVIVLGAEYNWWRASRAPSPAEDAPGLA